MKVFLHALDAAGHFNALIGVAQSLAERGHQIYFLEPEQLAGRFKEFGFEEILLKYKNPNSFFAQNEDPVRAWSELLKEEGQFSGRSAKDKLTSFRTVFEELYQKAIQFNPQIEAAIQREQPNLIIVDQVLQIPAVIYSGLPWIRNWSTNPLMIWESNDLPPPCSGLPFNDRTEWEEYRKVWETSFKAISIQKQNDIFKHFNYSESKHTEYILPSPYLNLYACPEELDYSGLVAPPPNFYRIDAYCRKLAEPFEFPEEFKQKIGPDDKLIYVSMGSMGSIDVDLMKRLVSVLRNTPHKYIVSLGPLHTDYELADNMWGEPWLPQTNILPLVDLVITHGGNNTVTESFLCGKPMIVMPLFVDQYDNAQRIDEKGYGIRMEPYSFEAHQLIDAINRLLNDDKLKLKLQQAAQRIEQSKSKDKLCDRLEEIVRNHSRKHINGIINGH